jgi:hypothetical protein
MSDLDRELRTDGQAWRDQVDAVRPVLSPARSRTPVYLAGLAAAAVVVALAVVVLVLRHPSHHANGRIAAGREQASSAPSRAASPGPVGSTTALPTTVPTTAPAPVRHVPQRAVCPTSGGGDTAYGSGFSVSFAAGGKGEPTIQAAAAKYPPKNVDWSILAEDRNSALLVHASHYLHVVRLPGGGWAVDSGGSCGGATATVAK